MAKTKAGGARCEYGFFSLRATHIRFKYHKHGININIFVKIPQYNIQYAIFSDGIFFCLSHFTWEFISENTSISVTKNTPAYILLFTDDVFILSEASVCILIWSFSMDWTHTQVNTHIRIYSYPKQNRKKEQNEKK